MSHHDRTVGTVNRGIASDHRIGGKLGDHMITVWNTIIFARSLDNIGAVWLSVDARVWNSTYLGVNYFHVGSANPHVRTAATLFFAVVAFGGSV